MERDLEARFERHREDQYAHGQMRGKQTDELGRILEVINARFLEVEHRTNRLEKFQWWLTGVGSAIALMVGGGGLALLVHR